MTDTAKTVPEEAKKYEGSAVRQQPVSEFDLRDNVIENLDGKRGIAHSGGVFRRYGDGVWNNVNDLEVEQAVAREMEMAAVVAAIRPTYSMQRSITNAIKSKTYVREDQWNGQPHILVFKNCVLDTERMKRSTTAQSTEARWRYPTPTTPTQPPDVGARDTGSIARR
jgi:hypothetical protein